MCFAGSALNSSRVPAPLFRRVVIVLIDALRQDFVFGSDGRRFMPYTRHVLERGSSHSFIAKARPPTVTMPRIKVNLTQIKPFLNLHLVLYVLPPSVYICGMVLTVLLPTYAIILVILIHLVKYLIISKFDICSSATNLMYILQILLK